MSFRLSCVSLLVVAVCLSGCRSVHREQATEGPLSAYDVEADWNDPQHLVSLNYEQAQGKQVFYQYCVWCHADSTPAGPSNRGNLQPMPALMDDGKVLNGMSDQELENIIALGGSAVGKSPSMPPWNRTLTSSEIQAVIAFTRAIAQPPYKSPVKTQSNQGGAP